MYINKIIPCGSLQTLKLFFLSYVDNCPSTLASFVTFNALGVTNEFFFFLDGKLLSMSHVIDFSLVIYKIWYMVIDVQGGCNQTTHPVYEVWLIEVLIDMVINIIDCWCTLIINLLSEGLPIFVIYTL